MKLSCPHCAASYQVDDRKIPATGANVRCPKCRGTFPVRPDAADDVDAAVPLPGPAAAAAPASAPDPGPSHGADAGSVLVPPPPPSTAPTPTDAIPLPPPSEPLQEHAAWSAPEPATTDSVPLPAPDESPGGIDTAEAAEPPLAEPPAFGEEFAAPDPLFSAPEPPGTPMAFGEVDLAPPASDAFSSDPFADPAPHEDPFAAAAPAATPPPIPPPRAAPPPAPTDDLEALFGEEPATPPAPSARETSVTSRFERAASGYRVRRSSGRVFGPFAEEQIADMLVKGELLGNEDVSQDGETWVPIASAPAFADAVRQLHAAPAAPAPGMPFGDRMAAAKVVSSGGKAGGRRFAISRRVATAIAAGVVVLALAGAGAWAGLTGRFGTLFGGGGSRERVASFVAQARAALAKDDFASERAALDLAARALALDEDDDAARAMYAQIAAALALGHGAPAGAEQRAQSYAAALAKDAANEPPALAAALALALKGGDPAALGRAEAALERAAAKAAPSPDVIALLARSSLVRRDGARAETLYAKLDALEPNGVRAPHGRGQAALLRGAIPEAKAFFEQALARDAGHLRSRLALAAIAEGAGDGAAAQKELDAVLAPEAEARLSPLERARALALRGALLSRRTADAAAADEAYQKAIEADPADHAARVALARLRLRRGDAAGAVAILDPLAASAAKVPEVAEVRITALARAGRVLDATQLAQAALNANPGDPALLLAQGGVVELGDNPQNAVKLYEQAAARVPDDWKPQLGLGRLALARGDLGAAATALGAAVEKGPDRPETHAGLASLALAQGDAAGAKASFEAALARDPEYAPALLGLAKIAIQRGDAKAGRAVLERALALDPRAFEAQLLLGDLLWKGGDLVGAERAYQAATDVRPKDAVALARLGATRLEAGNAAGALKPLQAAAEFDPRLAEVQHWLGRALLANGETPTAVARLKRATELEPAYAPHYLHLGIALERSGSLVEAVEAYRTAARTDPTLVAAHERIATLYAAHGRYAEALAAWRAALAVAPNDAGFRIGEADCLAKLGRHPEAIRIYQAVLRSNPGRADVPYRLARALHESRGLAAAMPWYERAAQAEKDNPMPHYYLGYAFKVRGQRTRAIQAFKAYLARKPDADDRKDIEREIEDLGGTL